MAASPRCQSVYFVPPLFLHRQCPARGGHQSAANVRALQWLEPLKRKETKKKGQVGNREDENLERNMFGGTSLARKRAMARASRAASACPARFRRSRKVREIRQCRPDFRFPPSLLYWQERVSPTRFAALSLLLLLLILEAAPLKERYRHTRIRPSLFRVLNLALFFSSFYQGTYGWPKFGEKA